MRFARGFGAVAGVEVPSFPDTEKTFAELQALIEKTLSFIGACRRRNSTKANRAKSSRPGTPKERRFNDQAYLLSYGLPQFFFHVTTACALLRHNGVELGKGDYMGKY